MSAEHNTENRLRDALRLHAQGDVYGAEKLIEGLPLPDSLANRAAYLRLHRDLGRPNDEAEAALDTDLENAGSDWHTTYDRARALYILDRVEGAIEAAKKAENDPNASRGPALLLLKIYLDTKRPKEAADAVLNAAKRRKKPGGLLLAGAKVLGQSGHREAAERLLDAAGPHISDDRAEFDYVAAGIRGKTLDAANQGEMAAAIFDKFASDYDEVLASIGNRGPELIGKMLEQLPMARKRSLEVLDAGCGTGLCAEFLKPYSKSLHGADISVPMLEKAKKRKVYDWLTRTDLNEAATIPSGPFDLIVLADVLIYFGNLKPVLTPLVKRLKPGGWLLLTVEDGGNLPVPGFELGPSGRHKHSASHVNDALSKAGLGRIKFEMRETLRHEFGIAIPGLAVAGQRPMLAF